MKGNFSVSIRNTRDGNEWEVADGLASKDEAQRTGERYIRNFILTEAQDRYTPVVYKIIKEEVHGP